MTKPREYLIKSFKNIVDGRELSMYPRGVYPTPSDDEPLKDADEFLIHVIEKQAADKLALALQNYIDEDIEMGIIYEDAKQTLKDYRGEND